jgi:bacillithiol synthase
LPNIAFIGGGGELAYWLELKNVFDAAMVFYPALILRNSFTIVNKNAAELSVKLKLKAKDYFCSENYLLEKVIKAESELQLDLVQEKVLLKKAYDEVKKATSAIDGSLSCHVHALRTQALNKLDVLEKKMLKAEKKKFEAQKRQIVKLKSLVSPSGNLQERVDNVLDYLSKYGFEFIETLYDNSNAIENNFTILTEQ